MRIEIAGQKNEQDDDPNGDNPRKPWIARGRRFLRLYESYAFRSHVMRIAAMCNICLNVEKPREFEPVRVYRL
jgi:hypothetical protein